MSSFYADYTYAKSFRDIPRRLKKTTVATNLPVKLGEVKRALDLGDTTTEDAELQELIPVAVEMVEHDAQRAFETETWKLYMDEFPEDVIELRMPPVISVTSVTYTDADGVTQTVSSANYDTDLTSEPARIIPAATTTGWPQTKQVPNAVTVTFTAGYSGYEVPRCAWMSIMLAVKALYHGCAPGDAYWSMIDRCRWEPGL